MFDIDEEIRLAKEFEKNEPYATAIYDNVLECYNALQPIIEKAGHSGCSYGFFVNILTRALKNKPLSPITDADCFGTDIDEEQCPRYSALFRHVDEDGNVTYNDVNRISVVDQHGHSWHSGFTEKCCKDYIKPITLPYMPTDNPIEIYVWDVTYDEDTRSFRVERGQHNATYVRRIVFPNGEIKEINKLFLESDKEFTDYSFEDLKSVVEKDIGEFKKL